MKMKFVTLNREVHKWTGVVLSLFLVIISLTGFFLIHKKSLDSFEETDVPNFMIPGLYQREMLKKGKEVEAFAMTSDDGSGPSLLTGTKSGLKGEQNGLPVSASRLGGLEIKSLLLTDVRWLAGTKRGLYESIDKGIRWDLVKRGPFENSKKIEIKVLEQSPWDANILWAGGKKGLFRSADGGEGWKILSHILPDEKESRDLTTIVFDPDHQGRVFFGTHNGIFAYQSGANRAMAMASLTLASTPLVQNPQISWEKYLDMLHTGKLFGDVLWLLYDLTAIAIILFVGSGLYIWMYPSLAKRRKKREKAAARARKTEGLRPIQPVLSRQSIQVQRLSKAGFVNESK